MKTLKKLKILFNTYPTAFDIPGGGEVQLMQTKNAIESFGHNIELYNQWSPQFKKFDLIHFFSVYGGSEVFCRTVKKHNIPLIVSPVLYPIDNLDQYPIKEINNILHLVS